MKWITTLVTMLWLIQSSAFGQKKAVADYKIANIKVVRFDESTGRFGDEVEADQWFGNDLSMSLFATVEVTGPAGEFVAGRNVSVRVVEGKKLKLSKIAYPGVINETGKYFIPVWLYGPMCEPVKITAILTGQKTRSSGSKTINFHCGE